MTSPKTAMMRRSVSLSARLLIATALLAGCQTTQGTSVAATAPVVTVPPVKPALSFDEWLKGLRSEAVAQGIRGATVDRAMATVRLSDRVQELDSSQPEFTRMVWQYLDSAVSDRRVQQGRQRLQENAGLLRRVSQRTGVPAEILVAHWGLESDYGASTGGFKVLDALTTLAYEGRRTGYFRGELLGALRIIDSGDIAAERMSGSWAGAMGQTQFMPTIFLKHARDEDGDGRRDIWSSLPDVFASTADFVRSNGWKAGERWGEEVRLPPGFPYDQAEYTITKPVAEWRRLGVVPVTGGTIAGEGTAAVLVLGGHQGPAFLVRDNYRAIMRYNPSTSYALAVALLADRIEGRPGVVASWPRHEQPLSLDERTEMQQRLAGLGYDSGGVDGIIGAKTRTAIRGFQASIGDIPDGFATKSLLERLRRAG